MHEYTEKLIPPNNGSMQRAKTPRSDTSSSYEHDDAGSFGLERSLFIAKNNLLLSAFLSALVVAGFLSAFFFDWYCYDQQLCFSLFSVSLGGIYSMTTSSFVYQHCPGTDPQLDDKTCHSFYNLVFASVGYVALKAVAMAFHLHSVAFHVTLGAQV